MYDEIKTYNVSLCQVLMSRPLEPRVGVELTMGSRKNAIRSANTTKKKGGEGLLKSKNTINRDLVKMTSLSSNADNAVGEAGRRSFGSQNMRLDPR